MRNRIPILLVLLSVPATAVLAVNSLTTNPHPPQAPFGQQALPENAVTITQSTDAVTITAGNSVACNNGVSHTDNYYYRGFTLSAFNPPLTDVQFLVQQVTIGVEQATDSTGAGQPLTVNLYDSSTNPPTNASLGAVISTQPVTVLAQSLTLLAIPLTTQPVLLNASDILAVEIFTPNGAAAGNSFFIGSNNLGQTGPSYLKAADCSVTEITNTAALGFPGMHIVMTVSGNNQAPVELTTFSVD